jgi:sensitive to high expression protein 9
VVNQGVESLVKSRRAAIDGAKQALDNALSKQASAQKEVVALLERKHSWSDMDLERYMSLIRSEHINDQAVREAKESIAQAENSLEEARSRLEKRERAQYHEEQIWSDTIRRNSTWVTFGLMGLNIFLLLATMVVIEPWRRRRMVREIRTALEAQRPAVEPLPTAATPVFTAVAEDEVDRSSDSVTTSSAAVDTVDIASPKQQDLNASSEQLAKVIEALPLSVTSSLELAKDSPVQPPTPLVAEESNIPPESINIEEVRSSLAPAPETWQGKITYIATDIISERMISMRRIDYTAAILQGAAAGALITATVVAMIMSK